MDYDHTKIEANFEAKLHTLDDSSILYVLREFIRVENYDHLFDVACGVLIDRNPAYGAKIEVMMDA